MAAQQGCENTTGPGPAPPEPIQIEFVPGAGLDLLNHPFGVGDPWIVGQALFLPVWWMPNPSETDAISVVAPTEFLETSPRQLPLFIQQQIPAVWLSESFIDTLAIDIAPVEELYQRAYGRLDPYVLRIVTRGSGPMDIFRAELVPVRTPPMHPETPRVNREAEEIALWLSGELIAPEALYRSVREELATIRETYFHRFPALQWVGFRPPNFASEIHMQFAPEVVGSMANGSYRAWDAPNLAYELTHFDTRSRDNMVALQFRGRQHPGVVAEEYIQLPGANFVYAWGGGIGDTPTLHPREEAGRRTYLFRDAWFDCLNGCIVSHYYYFRPRGRGFEFVGEWLEDRGGGPQEPRPNWWAEASQNVTLYQSWSKCCRFGQLVPYP